MKLIKELDPVWVGMIWGFGLWNTLMIFGGNCMAIYNKGASNITYNDFNEMYVEFFFYILEIMIFLWFLIRSWIKKYKLKQGESS